MLQLECALIYSLCSEPSILDDCQLDENTKDVLLTDIKRRMTPQAVKVRSDIEVACYAYEGIDAVKAALKEGLKFSTEELPVKVFCLVLCRGHVRGVCGSPPCWRIMHSFLGVAIAASNKWLWAKILR